MNAALWKMAQDQASTATPAVLLYRILAIESEAHLLSDADAKTLAALTPAPEAAAPPSAPPTP